MKKTIILIIILLVLILSIFGYFCGRDILFPNKYTSYINEYSQEYGLNPNFVKGVIRTESDYNPKALSNQNAKGLMQITDSTGEWIANKMGINNFTPSMLYDPKISIEFGCWYLKNLEEEFHNKNNVIAAYNAGQTNVENWLKNKNYSNNGANLDNIPFTQTANYVKKVNMYQRIYTKLYD
ncbi:MAG: lytic transglycosylase domain-containing protein [Sarcina sp.]